MKLLFALFLVFLSFSAVLSYSVDDLPETHISEDFINSVIRRSTPRRRRGLRRLNFELKKYTKALKVYKKRVRSAQSLLEKRTRKAKKILRKLIKYKKCIRDKRGRKRRACGSRFRIEKMAKKSLKRRARARKELKEDQRRLRKIQKKVAEVQSKLDKHLGNMVPRPSVSPLAIA